MTLKLAKFELDIDTQKTQAFYQTASAVSGECSCSGCRNYKKSIETLPQEIKAFFAQLGIDIKKPAEASVYNKNADNSNFYGGFYHICGKLISKNKKWDWVELLPGTIDDFRISFHNDCALVKPGFPNPVVQLEILANLPWVLDEPNDY